MPLDPLIVNSPKIDIGEPLADYTNYLQATHYKAAADKARRAESENALYNEGYRQNTDAQGTVNQNGLRAFLAQKGIGTYIPDVQKGEFERAKAGADIGKTQAETGKVNAEAFEKTWNNYKSELSSISHDPNQGIPQLVEWTKRQFADPVMGPMLKARGQTPESAIAELTNTLKTMPFDKFLLGIQIGPEAASKQHYETIKTNDRVITRAMPENSIGAPTQTTLSTDAMGHDPDAKYKGTHVNVTNVNNIAAKGDTAYTEQYNKHLADDDHDLKKAAEAAPDLIRRADRIREVLKTGKVITGAAAPARLGFEKIKDLVGAGDKELISNTERLGSDLASMTLEHIKSSGLAGSNGLTEGERGFLERAVAGQVTWDARSLDQMADIARKQGEATIQRYDPRYRDVKSTGIQGRAYPRNTPTTPPHPVQAHSNNEGFNQAVRELKAGRMSKRVFDAHYGAGAATSVGVN